MFVVVTLIVRLTENMVKYIHGQHELCRDLTKIEDNDRRKKLMVRKRMMNCRIRKRIRDAIVKLECELEPLGRWKESRDLEVLINELNVVASSPHEELRKIFRQKGKGIARQVKTQCRNCGFETVHDIIEFKGRRIVGSAQIEK